MSYQIKRSFEIDAGHRVPLHESKCKNLHGHRYKIDIYITYPTLDEKGFVMDFGKMKDVFGFWLDEHWDHGLILQQTDPLWGEFNSAPDPASCMPRWDRSLQKVYFMSDPPTAECMAKLLHEVFMGLLLARDFIEPLLDIVVYETPNCSARWPA